MNSGADCEGFPVSALVVLEVVFVHIEHFRLQRSEILNLVRYFGLEAFPFL